MSLSISPDGRFVLTSCENGTVLLWELEWDLEAPDAAAWDEGARPYLETFLTEHTPYADPFPEDRQPIDEQVANEAPFDDEDTGEILPNVVEEASQQLTFRLAHESRNLKE